MLSRERPGVFSGDWDSKIGPFEDHGSSHNTVRKPGRMWPGWGWGPALLTFFLILGLLSGSSSSKQESFRLHGEVRTEDGERVRGGNSTIVLRGAYTPFFRRILTDLGGRYHFEKVPQGVYTLGAISPRRGAGSLTVDISSSLADPEGRIRLDITVAPSAHLHEISLTQLAIPDKALRLFDKALKAQQKGDTDKAIQHLERAIEIAPGFSIALNQRGVLAYLARDYEVARDLFQRAAEADPEAYPPLVNLGGALVSLGLYEEAIPVNEQALRQRPNDPLALSQLGLACQGLGRDQEAAEYLTMAKEIEPGHFTFPQLVLANIFWEHGLHEAAFAELEEFLRLHPDVPQADVARKRLREFGRLP